ncbi:MAG: Dna[CI] antecedent, DciA [Bacteroidota bacterium]|jgi:predicted nucleic acid-binding Zn ribbon protein
MHQLRDLLRGFIKSRQLEGELLKARLPVYWEEVVGKGLAARTQIRSFEHGVLRVHVPEASWRSELILRREELRLSLNQRAGEDFVREIIIR